MACECIKNWSEKLKEQFGETATVNKAYMSDGTTRVVVTALFHKRKKNGEYAQKWEEVNLYPKYCPFCGEPYDEKEVEQSK